MVRRRLVQRDPEEGSQGEAVGATPGNGSLGAQPLEVAHEQHAEIGTRWDRFPAEAVGVEGLTEVLDVAVEGGLGEQAVELVMEDMAGGAGEIGGGDPKVWLLLRRAAPHAHTALLNQ